MPETDIVGVKISTLRMDETVEKALSLLELNRPSMIFTPNSEILYISEKDAEFRKILNSADLNIPDGIGVVYAAKILGTPLSERVSGYDLACRLLPEMDKRNSKLFLFGGKPGVADTAAENILKKYPNINICGKINGYFDSSEEIIKKINETQPDFLFVCLGAPKQEKWMYENRENLQCKVMLGIGGTIDVLAGTAKRSPDIFIKLNIEWLYRLVKNPSRFVRMLALPKFGFSAIRYKFNKNILKG